MSDVKVTILESKSRPQTTCIQYRYVLILLGLLGLLCVYVMRLNLNVAIVSMVNQTAVHSTKNYSTNCVGPFTTLNSTFSEGGHKDGPFNWDPVTQGLVLGSFYWGYILTPIPGGVLAEKCSAKWLFNLGVLCTAVLGLLIPVVTMMTGYKGLIVIRVLQGFGEGVTFPALEVLLAHWVPSYQRAAAVTYVHVGGFLGVVVGMFSAGELAAQEFLGGWPAVFYVSSTVSIIWCLVWWALITDTPQEHAYISVAELELIEDDLGKGHKKGTEKPPIPWRHILFSKSVWAVHIAFFGSLYLQYTLVTELPTYLGTVLNFNIRNNGLYSSLPYAGAIVASIISGHLCDAIITYKCMSRTTARKLINGIALAVPSLILFAVVDVAGCDATLSLTLFVVAGSLRGMTEAGVGPLPIDMAPDFAGTVFGISVMIGAISGMLVPYITGLLIQENNSMRNWSYSFYVAGVVGLASAAVFQIFGTAEVQPWGKVHHGDHGDKHKKKKHHGKHHK